jgi:serine protease inhibitor
MKKINFLILVLFCVIAASLVIFTKAICDDEDSAFDMLCNANDSFRFEEIFASILSYRGIFYEHHNVAISPISIMAYLERQEKSPPLAPKIFLTA